MSKLTDYITQEIEQLEKENRLLNATNSLFDKLKNKKLYEWIFDDIEVFEKGYCFAENEEEVIIKSSWGNFQSTQVKVTELINNEDLMILLEALNVVVRSEDWD